MATATLKNNGKSIKLQLLGSLEALTDTERAEITALLDALISETDEEWLEKLAGYDIAAKLRFLQFGKANILNSIMNKGMEIPDKQPFRTIFQLIDEIESGGGVGGWFNDIGTLDAVTPAISMTVE